MSDTDIIWALKTGDLDEVKAKLVTAEDVNRTLDGRKPLHHAADYNQTDVALYLIDKGAEINAVDKHGFTPLISACFESNAACVKVLLEKGADKDVSTREGIRALDAAAECETIKAMLQ